MQTLIIGISAIILIFSLFILNKKEKKDYDYVLLFINLVLVSLLWYNQRITESISPVSFIFYNILPELLHSLSLVYASLLLGLRSNWFRRFWWFFIYPVTFLCYLLLDVYVLNEDFNLIAEQRYLAPTPLYHFFYKSHNIFSIITGFWLLRQIKTHFGFLKDRLSFIENLRLGWLRNFVYSIIGINVFGFVLFIVYNVGLVEDIEIPLQILNAVIMLSFLYLGFYGIQQYSITPLSDKISETHFAGSETAPHADVEERPKRPLDTKLNADVYHKLEALFKQTELYTEPQLKIAEVAEQLNVPQYVLSQVINQYFGRPFYDYVAKYRVALLKEKLKDRDNKQFTILALGIECGFNSKASLNRIFKEQTGVTPSQYQRTHLGN